MSGRVHLILPDPHASPGESNDRATWAGKLILDLKPDVVIMMGDQFDFSSMSSYDKGRAIFQGRSYKKDLDAGLDFDEKLWAPIRKAKKKRPRAVALWGNHDHRLVKALDYQPELEGILSKKDLGFERNYDDIVEYEGSTPGLISVDGIVYSHYLTSGVMGRAIGGENHASSLISKQFVSCTVAHSHTTDFAMRSRPDGSKIQGLVAGVFQDYRATWAGSSNDLWWSGVIVKRAVENGQYSPQWISMAELKKEYA